MDEYFMDFNENAVLKTSNEIEVHAPVSIVWSIHADINAWSGWHPEISSASLMGELMPGSTFKWVSAGYKLESTIVELKENVVLGWIGRGFGASAHHVWEFTELDNGNTLVRTKEFMDGWLVKLFKGMMDKKLNRSLAVWLAALKAKAECR